MKFKWSAPIIFVILILPLKASIRQVTESNEVLEMLRKASEANRSLLRYGRIQASVHRISYDEKGQKSHEGSYDIRAVFKGEKVRLDEKEQRDKRGKTWRAVAT